MKSSRRRKAAIAAAHKEAAEQGRRLLDLELQPK